MKNCLLLTGCRFFFIALPFLAVQAHAEPEIRRIGAINWDAALPTNTYFGSHVARSLGPERFRNRTPYFASIVAPCEIMFPERTSEDFDKEFQYAIDAGLDYFAYCWYDDCPPPGSIVRGKASAADGHLGELTRTRRMHLQSRLRDKLALCAILITAHPYSDKALRDLACTMRESCYEKIDGRPLVYFFMGEMNGPLMRLKQFCRAVGVDEPYVVFMDNLGDSHRKCYEAADALSAYACCHPAANYMSLVDKCLEYNLARIRTGKPVIPFFSVGWNPLPRVERPVPWVEYDAVGYAQPPTNDELFAGARLLKAWIHTHRQSCPTGHVLVFAWNEFEEGGWICPNVGKSGAADLQRLFAFRRASELLRSNVCSDGVSAMASNEELE